MVARLAGAPLMGIVGSSGSGKSSALRAGLLAALAGGVLPGSEDWELALLRPGEHPVRALERATAEAAPASRLVVAVDQFEELFTLCRDEAERAAFVDELVAQARDVRRRALVLVAVRADFYGRCAVYPELSRLLGANHVLVGPMRRDELRRAIELPARRAGLTVDSDVVDALIADVEGEPGGLPLLSTALLELWQRRDGRRLRMSAYEHTGGVQGAIARLAENAYARLDPAQRETARRILLRLADHGEGESAVRRRVELAELDVDRDERVAEVLAVLADDRLVTIGEGEVEVAHEALLREWPRLRRWLEQDTRRPPPASAPARRRARMGRGRTRPRRALPRRPPGGRLGVVRRPRARAQRDRTHASWTRAVRRTSAPSAACARCSRASRRCSCSRSIAGVVALEQRGSAHEQAVAADAQRLGARALVEDDLDRALLLARQGVALDDSVADARQPARRAAQEPGRAGHPARRRRAHRERSRSAPTSAPSPPAPTPTRSSCSTRGPGGAWPRSSRRSPAHFMNSHAFSPDGRRLAVGYDWQGGPRRRGVRRRRRRGRRADISPDERRHHRTGVLAGRARLDVIVARVFGFGGRGPAVLMRFDARTGAPRSGPVPINRAGSTPLMITATGAAWWPSARARPWCATRRACAL